MLRHKRHRFKHTMLGLLCTNHPLLFMQGVYYKIMQLSTALCHKYYIIHMYSTPSTMLDD